MQYFITYVLGIGQISGKKADKGTIVHKALECLALAKKCLQDNTTGFDDEAVGRIEVDREWVFGNAFLEEMISKACDYYVARSAHRFTNADYRDCKNWALAAVAHMGGLFDPRLRDIISPERHFDFEIEDDWATFDYTNPTDGQKITGQLSLKGTVDLITQVRPDTYEVIDWKTGKRLDWATGEEKTFQKLCTDPQLRLYHYALSRLYPDIKNFIITIYFINDGGPFTIPFGPKDLIETKEMIRKRFNEVRSCDLPILNKSWRCDKICFFGKTPHKSGKINPKTGTPHTICSFIEDRLNKTGLESTIKSHTQSGHSVGYYQAPGA